MRRHFCEDCKKELDVRTAVPVLASATPFTPLVALVCSSCGRVDLHVKALLDQRIDKTRQGRN